jgi:hypothetical protein
MLMASVWFLTKYEPKPLLLATDKIRRGEWQRAVTQIGACKRLIAIVAASSQKQRHRVR